MSKLRIIHDNAADRAAPLEASTTAGGLVMSNVLNDTKGLVHRSTGTSVTYTATWPDGEAVGGAFLASNLTADATGRMRLYSDEAGTTLLADTGVVYACPGLDLGDWDWGQPINASAFPYGFLSKSQLWFSEQHFAKRCVIDLVDAGNPAGYIDCARLVVGGYWEASYNPDYVAEVTPVDTTQNSRTDAGDNRSDRGTQHETMSLQLSWLYETDRATLMRIAYTVGTRRNIVASLFPEGAAVAKQHWCIFGKRANSPFAARLPLVYSHSIDLESW